MKLLFATQVWGNLSLVDQITLVISHVFTSFRFNDRLTSSTSLNQITASAQEELHVVTHRQGHIENVTNVFSLC